MPATSSYGGDDLRAGSASVVIDARRRPGAPTMVFAIGCVAMVVALLLVIFDVPANTFYDVDGEPNRNTSFRDRPWDAMTLSASIDGNIKYVKEGTDHDPDSYNGYENAINESENAIAPLMVGVNALSVAVEDLDRQLRIIAGTADQMNGHLTTMASVSAHSAQTMGTLQVDIEAVARSMAVMYTASDELATGMADLEEGAQVIAEERTKPAREATEALNETLPDNVPPPQMGMTPGGAQ